jgi:hypothetical protein
MLACLGTHPAMGSGATAGEAGAAGSAGADAGPTCLEDTGTVTDCSSLSYYSTMCGNTATWGAWTCDYIADHGKKEVAAELLTCLAAINVSDHCSQEHEDAVDACTGTIFPKACLQAPIDDGDGGSYDMCDDVASTCTAIAKSRCEVALAPLTASAAWDVLDCYDKKISTAAACAGDFEDCLSELP